MKSNHSDFLGTYLVPGRASELGGRASCCVLTCSVNEGRQGPCREKQDTEPSRPCLVPFHPELTGL